MRFGSNSQTGVGVSSTANSHCDDTVVLDFDDDDEYDDNEAKKGITEYKNTLKEKPIKGENANELASFLLLLGCHLLLSPNQNILIHVSRNNNNNGSGGCNFKRSRSNR